MDQVIDVACAAKRAADQSAEADRRCVELSKLTRHAADHAASVRDLAASLAQTASSVARVALDVCRYHSYQQAFEETFGVTHPPPPIDIETFLSLVDNSKQTVGLATGSGSFTETLAQRGAGGVLGTCDELDEMTWVDTGNDLAQSRHQAVHPDESTSTDEMTQLTSDESHHSAVGGEYLSSFFQSVSVPAMYVQSRHCVNLVFEQYQ